MVVVGTLNYLQVLVGANLCTAAIADATITGSLCYLLHKGRTGIRRYLTVPYVWPPLELIHCLQHGPCQSSSLITLPLLTFPAVNRQINDIHSEQRPVHHVRTSWSGRNSLIYSLNPGLFLCWWSSSCVQQLGAPFLEPYLLHVVHFTPP